MEFLERAFEYFNKGGLLMYPLLLCSIATFMIAVERYIYYRTADSGSEFAEKLCQLLDLNRWDDAKDLAAATQGEAAAFATMTMQRSETRSDGIESFAGSKAERVLDRLEEYLDYLGVIIMLSPILGLFGTITGMMAAFNSLDLRTENPFAVTAGVAEALITTIFGLAISVAAICVHTYFGRRLKRATVDMEEISNNLVEAIERRKQ
ncbi:MAG: MotA/TolQ/ExbB proton channel family protein [Acidaminococcaceae bacterium]